MLIIQISDLHLRAERALLNRRYDSAGNLDRCVAAINQLPRQADLVIATGDLVQFGARAEYACLREILDKLHAPLLLLPGNHDNRQKLRDSFPEHDYLTLYPDSCRFVCDDYPLRIIALDTVIDGEVEGAIGTEQLEWLDDQLAARPEKPTLIAMHHPPFSGMIDFGNKPSCADGPALAALLQDHPQVRKVISGHLHRAIATGFAQTQGTVAPSTAVSFGIPFFPDTPFYRTDEPVGFQIHVWADSTDDSAVITHTVSLACDTQAAKIFAITDETA